VPGVKAHFFSSAGQFVNRLIDEDFVRSAVSTVNRWPSALTHTGVKCDPGDSGNPAETVDEWNRRRRSARYESAPPSTGFPS